MSLIDANASRIPEGDYLKMCNLMIKLNKEKNTLHVVPDVVGEDIVMSSECLNACHRWISSVDVLDRAFKGFMHDKLARTTLEHIEKVSTSFWYDLTRTVGFTDIMLFMQRGSCALRFYRDFKAKSRMNFQNINDSLRSDANHR